MDRKIAPMIARGRSRVRGLSTGSAFTLEQLIAAATARAKGRPGAAAGRDIEIKIRSMRSRSRVI